MFKFEMKGFDELHKKLTDIQRKIKDIEGKRSIPFNELFTPAFIQKNTQFKNLDEMFAKSGFIINSQEDLQKIPDKEWDGFIETNTKFKTWKEMLDSAVHEWVEKEIN